nr:hypothetical protein BaRGS_023700 [Batillaria attramentaria]
MPVEICGPDTAADVDSGCPSWGCLPSGTFALSSDIPGRGNANIGVKWNAAVSKRAGGRRLGLQPVWDLRDRYSLKTADFLRPHQALVSVCAFMSLVLERHGGLSGVGLSGTGSIWDGVCQGRGLSGVGLSGTGGYVDVDEKSGKVVWRYDNLTDPSLPILDIYGDVIGTDGRHLIKVQCYIQVANDNLLLMVSQEGLLITYATNGIPEASLTIRDELERVNGTFLPVAQPVIYGKRAYILMQFAPDAPLSPDKQVPL